VTSLPTAGALTPMAVALVTPRAPSPGPAMSGTAAGCAVGRARGG
jgi:hypothetical protein